MNEKQQEENLLFLKAFNTDLFKMVTTIEEKNYRTLPSKAGPLTLTYLHNNESYFIHSKFNPEAEAQKLVPLVSSIIEGFDTGMQAI